MNDKTKLRLIKSDYIDIEYFHFVRRDITKWPYWEVKRNLIETN